MFRPQVLLATLVVPTTAYLLYLWAVCVVYFRAVPASVTFAGFGYTNHLNRAIGGRTFTSLALGLTSCSKDQYSKLQRPRTSGNPPTPRQRTRPVVDADSEAARRKAANRQRDHNLYRHLGYTYKSTDHKDIASLPVFT